MEHDEIARWLQEEHLKLQTLSDTLREKVAVAPHRSADKWIEGLARQFDKFRAHCCKHFAMEEQGGYLLLVLERRPTLSARVAQLKHDHQEIMQLLDSVQAEIAALHPSDQILIDDCRDRIRRCLRFCEAHEKEENSIVSYVLTTDEGTKD